MKKLIVLFLVCIAAVQFSACGKEPAVNNTVTPESKQEEQTSSQSSFDPRACAESAVRSYFMQRCNEELADP